MLQISPVAPSSQIATCATFIVSHNLEANVRHATPKEINCQAFVQVWANALKKGENFTQKRTGMQKQCINKSLCTFFK
jgi:transcriptional regulator of met regulon